MNLKSLLYLSCELERLPAFCDDCCHRSHTKKQVTQPLLNWSPQKFAGTNNSLSFELQHLAQVIVYRHISGLSFPIIRTFFASYLRLEDPRRVVSSPVPAGLVWRQALIWPPWRFASPPPQCFSDRDILKRWARECEGSEDGEWKGFRARGRGLVQVWGAVLAGGGAGSWQPSKGDSGRLRQDPQGCRQVLRRGWIVSC